MAPMAERACCQNTELNANSPRPLRGTRETAIRHPGEQQPLNKGENCSEEAIICFRIDPFQPLCPRKASPVFVLAESAEWRSVAKRL